MKSAFNFLQIKEMNVESTPPEKKIPNFLFGILDLMASVNEFSSSFSDAFPTLDFKPSMYKFHSASGISSAFSTYFSISSSYAERLLNLVANNILRKIKRIVQ